MFHHISKHLKFRQKYSAAHHIFNSLLSLWKCDETLSRVFDILHITVIIRGDIIVIFMTRYDQCHHYHDFMNHTVLVSFFSNLLHLAVAFNIPIQTIIFLCKKRKFLVINST